MSTHPQLHYAYILLHSDDIVNPRATVVDAYGEPVYVFKAELASELGDMIQDSEYSEIPLMAWGDTKTWRPEPGYSVAECVESCWQ